jgi:hypothetical protein
VVFFDELIEDFYVTLSSSCRNPEQFQQGQIFFAAVPYSDEQRQYWRPANYDKLTQTNAKDFNILGGATDLFRRQLPLYVPKLEVNEEFLVVRAKKRPVVLIARPGTGILGRLAKHHLVIPRYGAVKGKSEQPKFPQEVVNRIRTLEFPDVLFTPASAPVLAQDGFFASHLLQPLPLSQLDPTNLALGPKALTVLCGQILHRCFGVYSGEYADWREMLLNPQ